MTHYNDIGVEGLVGMKGPVGAYTPPDVAARIMAEVEALRPAPVERWGWVPRLWLAAFVGWLCLEALGAALLALWGLRL